MSAPTRSSVPAAIPDRAPAHRHGGGPDIRETHGSTAATGHGGRTGRGSPRLRRTAAAGGTGGRPQRHGWIGSGQHMSPLHGPLPHVDQSSAKVGKPGIGLVAVLVLGHIRRREGRWALSRVRTASADTGKVLRDCRLEGNGVHLAMFGITVPSPRPSRENSHPCGTTSSTASRQAELDEVGKEPRGAASTGPRRPGTCPVERPGEVRTRRPAILPSRTTETSSTDVRVTSAPLRTLRAAEQSGHDLGFGERSPPGPHTHYQNNHTAIPLTPAPCHPTTHPHTHTNGFTPVLALAVPSAVPRGELKAIRHATSMWRAVVHGTGAVLRRREGAARLSMPAGMPSSQ